MQETQVQSLRQKDPLEKEMASILAWKISWTEEPGGLQSIGSQKVRHNWVTTHIHTQEIKGRWWLSRAFQYHCSCPPLSQSQAVPAGSSPGLDPDPWIKQHFMAPKSYMLVLVFTGFDPWDFLCLWLNLNSGLFSLFLPNTYIPSQTQQLRTQPQPLTYFTLPLIPRDTVS